MAIQTGRSAWASAAIEMAAAIVFVAAVVVAGGAAADLTIIDDTGVCTKSDLKTLQRQIDRGRPFIGDRDLDGISNCTEKRVLGTSYRDEDSDDDGVDDGDELDNGTDPMDADSDDDGMDDGDEESAGSDPLDEDSDDDGELDGDDLDPAGDLDDEIESDVVTLVCPAGGADGLLSLAAGPGIDVVLTDQTEYDGVESCQDLADRIETPNPSDCDDGGAVHVEVELLDDDSAFIAAEVDLEDADCDGSPDIVDDDDDNDGIDDDDDPDDDGDGIDDETDDDDQGDD